jgi:hypothetical protein
VNEEAHEDPGKAPTAKVPAAEAAVAAVTAPGADLPPVTAPPVTDAPKTEEEIARDLYNEHRKQAWADIQSSSDNFDQSLMTVSSAALGVSLLFIKDIVPLKDADWLRMLYVSWLSFAICIVLTVFSFRLSVAAQTVYLQYLRKYYIEKNSDYFNKQSWQSKWLSVFTWAASVLFLAGLACTVIFCVHNVARSHMNKDSTIQAPVQVPTDIPPRLPDQRKPMPMEPISTPDTPKVIPDRTPPPPPKKDD